MSQHGPKSLYNQPGWTDWLQFHAQGANWGFLSVIHFLKAPNLNPPVKFYDLLENLRLFYEVKPAGLKVDEPVDCEDFLQLE